MKKINLFLLAAVSAALTSCSGNESADNTAAPVACKFTASIGGAQTRAYNRTWEEGDLIGITCTSGEKQYGNVKYKISDTGAGSFDAATAGEEIYYQDGKDVTFTAYYPWNSLQVSTTAVAADTYVQQEAAQKTYDFLWAQASGNRTAPAVALAFKHKMAKLVITVKRGSDVSYEEVEKACMAIGGFCNNGTFDVTTGTAAATGDKSGAWTFANNADNTTYNAPVVKNTGEGYVQYSLILFPQELGAALPISATLTGMQSFNASHDFAAENEALGDSPAKNGWVAGRQYNLSVTLYKTKLIVNGCTINDWEPTAGSNEDAH